MLKGFKQIVRKYGYLILPMITLLCFAGFIGSYLFPNKVLDTYEVNMEEDEGDAEIVCYLTGAEDEIGYAMETDSRALQGIQIGISKNGASLEGTELIYRVYRLPEEVSMNELPSEVSAEGLTLLVEKSYDLGACMNGQYPYLSFDEEDLCSGKLYLTFTFRANDNEEGIFPGIFMNHASVDQAATYIGGSRESDLINGAETERMLKGYYIYSHDTYPLLYDARVLTFVFLAASATVCYPKHRKKPANAETIAREEAVNAETTPAAGMPEMTERKETVNAETMPAAGMPETTEREETANAETTAQEEGGGKNGA